MFRKHLISLLLLAIVCPQAWADTSVSFGATVYAEQSMTENASCSYMVHWALDTQGNRVDASNADISNHVTTLTIDASAITGTVSSISVYAIDKTPIAGPMAYNGNFVSFTTNAYSVYCDDGLSDVVTVNGSAKTCKVYLRPVSLPNGVMVTVHTSDGKFWSQTFSSPIAPRATQTLTLNSATDSRLWMSTIPGDIYFSFVSTPGAHDAATSSVSGTTSSYAKCQGEDIATLLANGVRGFDIRPNYNNSSAITADNLYIYHGTYNTNVKYVDAMATLVEFVRNNPSEAISVIMVKENGSGSSDRSEEMWPVINACHAQYGDVMKLLDHSYYTLDDFRGKICYINRTGSVCTNTTRITNWPDNGNITDYSAAIGSTCVANIQDKYNSNGSTKQNEIKSMLGYSSSNTEKKRFHYNYCSSAYQIMGSAPGTYASKTNPVITSYLNEGNISGPTGYLYADYIGSSSNGGAALLTAIINQNYRYVYKGRSRVSTSNVSDPVMHFSHTDGWERVTAIQNPSAYYYALVDKNIGLALSLENGTKQSTDAAYKTMVYRAIDNIATTPAMYWKLETNSAGGYSIMSAVPGTDKYIQTEWNEPWYCRMHDNGGGDASWYSWLFAYDASNEWWTIQNGKYPDSGYIGPWADNGFSDGNEVAANKSGSNIGHYELYAIPRQSVSLEPEASEEDPVDYTSRITNPSFESGNTNGWINTVSSLFGAVQAGAFTNKVGSWCAENWWTASNNFSFHQQLSSLPNGIYDLKALCINVSTNHDVFLFAGSNKQKVNVHDNPADQYTVRACVTDGTLTIGIHGAKPAQSWVAVDNFELYYLGTGPNTKLEEGQYYAFKAGEEYLTSDAESQMQSAPTEGIEYYEAVKSAGSFYLRSFGNGQYLKLSNAALTHTAALAEASAIQLEAADLDGHVYMKLGNTRYNQALSVIPATKPLLTLVDADGYNRDTDIDVLWVKYSRTVTTQWSTLVLPFALVIDPEMPYDLYELKSVSSGSLSLSRFSGTLPANTPALLRLNGEEVNGKSYTFCPVVKDIAVKAVDALSGEEKDGFALTGTYGTIDMKERSGYVISGNQFWSINMLKEKYPSSNLRLTPFRAWLSGTEQGSTALRIGMEADEEETGLSVLEALTTGSVQYFDLNGRQLPDLQQGVNIIRYANGRTGKVIVK